MSVEEFQKIKSAICEEYDLPDNRYVKDEMLSYKITDIKDSFNNHEVISIDNIPDNSLDLKSVIFGGSIATFLFVIYIGVDKYKKYKEKRIKQKEKPEN